MNITEIWADAQNQLEKQVSAVSFELWIKSLEPIDLKNGILYLSTTSETAKQRIMQLHKGEIFVAVTGACDEVKDFAVLDPADLSLSRSARQSLPDPLPQGQSDEAGLLEDNL